MPSNSQQVNSTSGDEENSDQIQQQQSDSHASRMSAAPSATLSAPGPFQKEIDGSSNSARWKAWFRKFETFEKAAGLKEDILLPTLLNIGGEQLDEVVLVVTKQNDDYKKVTETVAAHFERTKNLDKIILAFRRVQQRQGEGIEHFVVRLRTLVTDCEFDKPDDEIRLQLIAGASDPKVQEKAFESKKTFSELYDYARSLEVRHAEKRRPPSPQLTHSSQVESAFQLNANNSTQPHRKCRNCGYEHARDDNCPAQGQTCSNCGKPNHFSKVCRAQRNDRRQVRQPAQSQPNNQPRQDRNVRWSEQNRAYQVTTPTETTRRSALPPSPYYNIFAIGNEAPQDTSTRCPRVVVEILGSAIEMGIDTQASVNAMSEQAYERMAIEPRLRPCEIKAYSFDGKTPIIAVGAFKAAVKANKRSVACDFVVFKEVRDYLLSFKASTDLGLVQLTYKLD